MTPRTEQAFRQRVEDRRRRERRRPLIADMAEELLRSVGGEDETEKGYALSRRIRSGSMSSRTASRMPETDDQLRCVA